MGKQLLYQYFVLQTIRGRVVLFSCRKSDSLVNKTFIAKGRAIHVCMGSLNAVYLSFNGQTALVSIRCHVKQFNGFFSSCFKSIRKLTRLLLIQVGLSMFVWAARLQFIYL